MDASEIQLWEYPDLVKLLDEESGNQSEINHVNDESSVQENKIKEDERYRQEVEALKQKIYELKNELENKVNTLNQLIQSIKLGLGGLSNEICNEIDYVVRNMVKKIIQKEIYDSPEISIKLIATYKKLIKPEEKIISIQISPEIYERIQSMDIEDKNLLVPNPELNAADLIIRTDDIAIRAIIDETIDKMMSENDDDAV